MMKPFFHKMVLVIFCLYAIVVNAQLADTLPHGYGIWQTFGDPMPRSVVPELNGRLCNFNWKDIEPQNNVWDWTGFDSDLTARAKDTLPITFMVYTEEDAPDWLYTNGVPKVAQKDANGNVIAYTPYYADSLYNIFFKRMITMVRLHVETLPASVRNQIIAVQGCYGSTGDYISYKGTVDPKYQLSSTDFYRLFQDFSSYYYNEYSHTNPKIYLLSNPKNTGSDQMAWLIDSCPGSWIKTGTLGKGYQLNDEVAKSDWLYNTLNVKQNGDYVRSRSEIIGSQLNAGWWLECPYKHMFALMAYCIYWGVDWSNQSTTQLNDPLFDSSFGYYNKYAGQKDPSKSNTAMCFLKDALDAGDSLRFPSVIYGPVTRTTDRFNKVLAPFVPYGAKLEDSNDAVSSEMTNLTATGINDVGWGIFPGNYDRYLHQINANTTSAGYWNVQSSDANTMYGRFARGFDLANGKDALYFDVDNQFLNNAPLNGQYPVMISITYLDKGNGSWQLFFDSKLSSNKPSIAVTCGNTGLWKKASVTLAGAYFGNRSVKGSDFYIKSTNSSNVIFDLVELERPNADASDTGLFASSLAAFDTSCTNSISLPQTCTISGSFLNNSAVIAGPLKGFGFAASASGPYSDSLTFTNYGATFKQLVYVQFTPSAEGAYSGNIPLRGGGASKIYIPAIANASSPASLSANVSNISCYNSKDGMIDLTVTGASGSVTYSWVSNTGNNFKSSNQDVNSLTPADYTVTVSSQGGCKANAVYTVSQPDPLTVSATADPMLCKAGTTNVYITATGGTLPYSGTGILTSGNGSKTYTVQDANGCSAKQTISIPNGTLQKPAQPGTISGITSDATGICGAGNFAYLITPVANANSYTWTIPQQSAVASKSANSTAITITTQSNFSGGNLSVTADNACGSSPAQIKQLSIIPGNPGNVSGKKSVKAKQQSLVYSVVPVAGLSYSWTVPGGVQIISAKNAPSITVNWGNNSGNVTVKAINGCGSSSVSTLNVQVSASLGAANESFLTSETFSETATLMPNPAKDICFLKFNVPIITSYTLSVSDLTGKLLVAKRITANAGDNKISMDVSGYAPGIYMVALNSSTEKAKAFRLVKE